MHCLVLYCYLLASTKRGNESEGPPPPRRARLGSHNNIAPFRPPPTRRPRPHTNSRAAGRGRARAGEGGGSQRRCSAVVVSSPPLSSSPPSPPPTHSAVWTNGRWRQISQEQNGCNALALRSLVAAWQPLDGCIVNISLLELKLDILILDEPGFRTPFRRILTRCSGIPRLWVAQGSANGRLVPQCGSARAEMRSPRER